MSDKPIMLTELELEALVKKATREAVHETFTALGIDMKEPLEVQKDFHFIRETRKASDSIKEKGLLALLGILSSGLLAALWIGIKEMIKRP